MNAREAAEALYDAYNRRDASAAAALYAPDGVHEEIATLQRKEGPEAIREGLERFFRAFPDANWEQAQLVAADRAAASTYRLT